MLADLYAAANAPLFGAQNVLLGHGIVGGAMTDIDELSRTTADVAVRLFERRAWSPSSLSMPPQAPAEARFDWRQLQRWDIPEDRLPMGQPRPLSKAQPVE